LQLQPDDKVVFERYSDSQSSYVILDPDHPQVYKTLFRAAKAKLKLRLRATLVQEPEPLGQPIGQWTSGLPDYPIPSLPAPVIARTPSHVPQTQQAEPKPETSAPSPVLTQHIEPEVQDPLSHPNPAPENKHQHMRPPVQTDLALRQQKTVESNWLVYCNSCEQAMQNVHFHCGICENGDYDLCPACVNRGVHCPGEGHWLVKRFVKDGSVEISTTERITIMPKPKLVPAKGAGQGMPGAFMEEKQPVACPPPQEEPDRTCNCCVKGR
jgi:next-to-BRCA1 protein 1